MTDVLWPWWQDWVCSPSSISSNVVCFLTCEGRVPNLNMLACNFDHLDNIDIQHHVRLSSTFKFYDALSRHVTTLCWNCTCLPWYVLFVSFVWLSCCGQRNGIYWNKENWGSLGKLCELTWLCLATPLDDTNDVCQEFATDCCGCRQVNLMCVWSLYNGWLNLCAALDVHLRSKQHFNVCLSAHVAAQRT